MRLHWIIFSSVPEVMLDDENGHHQTLPTNYIILQIFQKHELKPDVLVS
jgi:hypothetical protein